MNLTAFALVVVAACLHALWNLAAKRVSGNLGVLWLGLCLAGIALSSALQSLDPAGLPYLLATGLIHAAHRSIARGRRRMKNLCKKLHKLASRRRQTPIPASSAEAVRRTSRRSSPDSASSAA